MKTSKHNLGIGQTVIALAVLAAFGPAQAQVNDEVKQLTKPESSVSVGLGGVSGDSKDRAQFGIFNGMRKDSGYLLFDIDYLNRDDATGTWTTLQGRNLGLDNRELRAGMQKQGDWKLQGEYNEITRHSPYTINTADLGVGTATPTVVRLATPGTGVDIDLKTSRKSLSVAGEKWLMPNLQFEASFKSEDKDGARMWGRGYDCASYVCGTSTTTAPNQALLLKNAILMVAEPIKSTISQFEAKFNFHDEKLLLSAGYYGTFYKNSLGNIKPTVPGALNGGNGTLVPGLYPAVGANIIAGGGTSLQDVLQLPMSLQPDNQAHQFSLAGNYAFTPSTKATFKYAYTHATQDKNFASMGLSGSAPGSDNLGGVVDTVTAQFGLTAKPMPKLSLLANVSYQRKEDKTPNALYNVEAKAVFPATTPTSYTNVNQIGVPGAVWNNNHVSSTYLNGKMEASYQLPDNYRATLGIDYKFQERLVPESRVEEALAGLGPLRADNKETGYRLELKRNMSETLNGGIAFISSKRKGSDWTNLSTLNPGSPTPNTAANTYLINTYCGGRECYGQVLPASSILGLSATTPFPMNMTDIQRDKWKLSADWNPSERFSLQFMAEDGKDKNDAPFDPVAGPKGWRDSGVTFYSIDAAFVLSDNWKLTAYASHGDQTLHVNHSTGYMLDLNNLSDAFGLGLVGKASGKLQIGANLSVLNDVTKYGIKANTGTAGDRLTGLTVTQPTAANLAQAAVGLPDVTLRKTTLNLFGRYALQKNADIRVDLIYQNAKFNEWVWGNNGIPFVYGDNTTVKQQADQSTTFIGASYIYKWQ